LSRSGCCGFKKNAIEDVGSIFGAFVGWGVGASVGCRVGLDAVGQFEGLKSAQMVPSNSGLDVVAKFGVQLSPCSAIDFC